MFKLILAVYLLFPSVTFAKVSQAITNKIDVVPVGSVVSVVGKCPIGYKDADGSSLNKSDFPKLLAVIQTVHGSINAISFNLPDYRSPALRGLASTSVSDCSINNGGLEVKINQDLSVKNVYIRSCIKVN